MPFLVIFDIFSSLELLVKLQNLESGMYGSILKLIKLKKSYSGENAQQSISMKYSYFSQQKINETLMVSIVCPYCTSQKLWPKMRISELELINKK
jgi:hypothetical protein